MLVVTCPYCGANWKVPDKRGLHAVARCLKCGRRFSVGSAVSVETGPEQGTPEQPPKAGLEPPTAPPKAAPTAWLERSSVEGEALTPPPAAVAAEEPPTRPGAPSKPSPTKPSPIETGLQPPQAVPPIPTPAERRSPYWALHIVSLLYRVVAWLVWGIAFLFFLTGWIMAFVDPFELGIMRPAYVVGGGICALGIGIVGLVLIGLGEVTKLGLDIEARLRETTELIHSRLPSGRRDESPSP